MTTSTLDDYLMRAAGGDQAAFASVYDMAAPLVFGVALRVVRDRARAEEVTQEVLIEAWRTAPRFDPERGSAKAWLATLAHRRAVDAVRRNESSKAREARVAQQEDRPFDDVQESVERADTQARVRKAFSVLTAPQRQVIELAYYGGMTYREVAESTGTPVGTVKTRMRSALARLGDILGVEDG